MQQGDGATGVRSWLRIGTMPRQHTTRQHYILVYYCRDYTTHIATIFVYARKIPTHKPSTPHHSDTQDIKQCVHIKTIAKNCAVCLRIVQNRCLFLFRLIPLTFIDYNVFCSVKHMMSVKRLHLLRFLVNYCNM